LSRHPYIAVEGVIGVGKTTLVRLLSKDFNAEPLLEVFEENPFLSDFYSDRARYAFQTQIFFLLSRYRQQHDVIPRALMRSALISDYTFAKDALFARLNLGGDELAVYNRLHAALAEKIPKPDLLVYLRAGLDMLMARIAARDRPYERAMDRRYIESLRLAYDGFVAGYTDCPVLAIDTDELNFVQDLGATFGPVKLDLPNWRRTPVWADRATCTVSMKSLPYGGATFPDRRISEAGRQMLTGLLEQLSSGQLTDLFTASRVIEYDEISAETRSAAPWVEAFRNKIRQIADGGPCPQAP